MTVFDSMQCLSTTMSQVIATMRQAAEKDTDSGPLAADLCFLRRDIHLHFNALVSEMDSNGLSGSKFWMGLSPEQIEDDNKTGLSCLCCDLIHKLISSHNFLPGYFVSRLIIIPCRYLGMHILPLESRQEEVSSVISKALDWASTEREWKQVDSDAMFSYLGSLGMAIILSASVRTNLTTWIYALRPRCLIEQLLCMMCRQPNMVNQVAAENYMQAVMEVGNVYANTNFSAMATSGHWLHSPCMVFLYKRCLSISRHPVIAPSYTDNLLNLTFNTALIPRQPAAIPSTSQVDMADDVHLRHLRDMADAGLDGERWDLTVALVYKIVKKWSAGTPFDDVRRSGVISVLRLLCGSALASQRHQLAGHVSPTVQDAAHIHSLSIALAEILGESFGGLSLDVRSSYGTLAAVETLFRWISSPDTREMPDMIIEGLCILSGFPRNLPACLSTCISLAASLRKLVNNTTALSGVVTDIPKICLSVIVSMQKQESARQTTELKKDAADWTRLTAIIASIMTSSLAEMAWPSGAQMSVRQLQSGHCVTAVIKAMIRHVDEHGANKLPGRAAQGAVWDRFSAAECTPWMLPGCGNLMCNNMSGCSEAALHTQLCSGCRRVRYCCVDCQRTAWKAGGHEVICTPGKQAS